MGQSKDEVAIARGLDWLDRNWKWIVVLVWLGFCGWFIFNEWSSIRYFGLGDTDDNMRIMQVRAWLHGQGWYDLRNYRMNPPYGANIHWSRLVDLPIAGLILTLRPFQETACHLPQLIAVIAQHDRVRHSGKHSQLPIAIRKLREKADEVFFGGDPVVFAAHEQDGCPHF